MRTFTSTQMREWLAGVGRLAGAVAASTPLNELLDLIARTACELTGYEAAAVLLADDSRRHLVISGSAGLAVDYVAEVNEQRTITLAAGPLSAGPSTRAFTTGTAVIIADVRADASFSPWANAAGAHGYRSIASVPLLLGGESVGTLNCYRTCVHDFGAEEIALLAALANQASTALQSSQLIACLTRERRLSEQSESIHRELTQVALRSGGVQGVAEALARLHDRPVLVTDADQLPLANVSRRGVQLAAEPIPHPGLPERGVAEASDGRVTAPVVLGGELVARIWLPGQLAEFSALDIRAMEHAAVVCALELLRQRTATDVEWKLRSDLLADLLATGPTGAITARAVALGHDLTHPHTVVVAAADAADPTAGAADPGAHRALLAVVRDVCAGCQPRPLVTTIGEDVVVLWPDRADAETASAAADRIRVAMHRRGRGDTATVVLGHRLDRVDDARTAVSTARGALAVARLRGRDRVVTLPDLGVYGLLVQLNDPRALTGFADHTLRPLRDYDARRKTELIDTVRSYLDNGLSIRRTAAALYVHQNTVGLRLRKVEELVGVSMREPEGWLRLQVALMADEVFGGAPPPTPPPPAGTATADHPR